MVDEPYVTPLVVAILRATAGRIVYYFLDRGLLGDSLAKEKGARWTRIDIVASIPSSAQWMLTR